MIVPMKKVSLITLGNKRSETLKELRKMGLMHIEIAEGNGERINELKGQITMLENAVFSIEEKINKAGFEVSVYRGDNLDFEK
jgi:vacuolar-type H+-ATPase subunit I/STV1